MQFHNAAGVIPGDTPDQTFLDVRVTTLLLDTQKNCVRGESTSIEATGLKNSKAVSTAAWPFIHLYSNGATPDNPIYTYCTTHGSTPSSIPSRHITHILHSAAHKLGFQKICFILHEIGSHSLQSGEVMALYLAGV